MKNEKVSVSRIELCKLIDYLEKDEHLHYMSYEYPRPKDHIYTTIKYLKKQI